MTLPVAFLNTMQELLGKDFEDFLKSYKKPHNLGLRVNTLKTTASYVQSKIENLLPVPWCADGFCYEDGINPAKLPFFNAGLYYIQEPSAMLPVEILDVKAGDIVLDLCASPGGKSTQIAAKLQNTGLLVTNDINSSRIPQLIKNIEKFGTKNAVITCDTPQKLAEKWAGIFDKILIDAPCSGEGMFRKDNDSILAWDENKAKRLSHNQLEILNYGSKMLKPGGELVYSTCTFSKTENENIICQFLENNPDFEQVFIDFGAFGVSGGYDGKSARIFPHLQAGEGHFAAKIRKKVGYANPQKNQPKKRPKVISKSFDEFCRRYLTKELEGEIAVFKGGLCLINGNTPNLDGIKTIRPGLFLGTLKNERFEPSSALAFSLFEDDFSEVVSFGIDDTRLLQFLGGQTFEVKASDGYKLFCVDRFPIGFGKVLHDRVKWHSR